MVGNALQCNLTLGFDSRLLLKTGDRRSTQLAKMSIDPEFVELTADDSTIILEKSHTMSTTDITPLAGLQREKLASKKLTIAAHRSR